MFYTLSCTVLSLSPYARAHACLIMPPLFPNLSHYEVRGLSLSSFPTLSRTTQSVLARLGSRKIRRELCVCMCMCMCSVCACYHLTLCSSSPLTTSRPVRATHILCPSLHWGGRRANHERDQKESQCMSSSSSYPLFSSLLFSHPSLIPQVISLVIHPTLVLLSLPHAKLPSTRFILPPFQHGHHHPRRLGPVCRSLFAGSQSSELSFGQKGRLS